MTRELRRSILALHPRRKLMAQWIGNRTEFSSAPRPSEQEETVTQHYRRRAWSVLIVIGSVLTAAAIWKLPAAETRGH